MRLQFRGELFNLPNHPNFGTPGRTFGGAGFGVVNSARPGPSIQLGLRLVSDRKFPRNSSTLPGQAD